MGKDYIYNSDKVGKIIIDDIVIGKEPIIIAGPCTFGSYEEIYEIAKELKKLNIYLL